MPEGGSGLGIWGGQSLSLAALGGESLRVPAAWEGSAGESPMPWDVAGLVGPDDAADELFRGGGLAALQGEGGRAAGEGDVSLGLPGPHAASLHAGRGLTKVVGEVGRQMSGWGTGGDAGAVGAVGEGGAGGIEAELERVKQERDSLERKLRAMERREPPEPALPATNQLHTELIVSGGGAANHDAAWKEGDGGEASPLVPSSGLGLVLEQGEPQASPSGQPHRILKGAKSVKEAEASASPASGGGSRGSEGDEWGSLAPAAADAWSSAAAPARRRVSFHDPPALEAHALGLRKGKGKLSAGKDSSSQCGENVGSPHDSAAEGQEEPAKRGGPGASEQGAAVAVEATKGREGESCGPKASEQSQESQQQQRKTPEKAKREVSASSVGEGPVLRVDPKKKAEVPRETVRGAAAPTKKGETEGAGGGKGGAGGKASRGKDNRRSSNQASHGRGKHGRWQAGGEDDDDEDEEDDEAAGLLGRLWRLLCQLDGELGSCTLTLAYFWVYLALHGPTTRLLIIGLIVLTQLSYTVQYPLALWAPINSALDTARDSTLRIFGRGGGAWPRKRRLQARAKRRDDARGDVGSGWGGTGRLWADAAGSFASWQAPEVAWTDAGDARACCRSFWPSLCQDAHHGRRGSARSSFGAVARAPHPGLAHGRSGHRALAVTAAQASAHRERKAGNRLGPAAGRPRLCATCGVGLAAPGTSARVACAAALATQRAGRGRLRRSLAGGQNDPQVLPGRLGRGGGAAGVPPCAC